MPAIAEPAELAYEHEGLSKTQKLAGLLVMLGPESTAMILKQFKPREVEAISSEMGRFHLITREQQQEILMEFSNVAVAANTPDRPRVETTRQEPQPVLRSYPTRGVLSQPASPRVLSEQARTIADVEPQDIFNAMRGETAQTMTFILSHLPHAKTAQVLNLLPPAQRSQIVERLTTLAPTPVEVGEKVMEVFNARLGIKPSRTMMLAASGADLPPASHKNSLEFPGSEHELV